MKRLFKLQYVMAVLALFVAFGTIDVSAQKKTARKRPVLKKTTVAKKTVTPAIKYYTIDSGEKLHVRLNNALSSKTSKVGDTFTANVTEQVYSNGGIMVIPSGSVVMGRVTAVTPAAKEGKPGAIDVTFYSLKTPNGATRAINGSLTELDAKNTKSDNEGTASAGKMEHRKIIFIGGGAAGGAVLGAAIGGGKGALIGGLLGAGGGFLGDRLTKGKEAEVNAGTEFGVILNQSASFPKYVEPVQ